MNLDKKEQIKVEEPTQSTIKVDGGNIRNATRHFEKNMYKALRNRLNELKNKPGRSVPVPKEEKGKTR